MSGDGDPEGRRGIESGTLQAGVAVIYPADVSPLPGVEGGGLLTRRG